MLTAASQMGFKRVLILQGIEGNEDAPTSRPCRAFLWSDGERDDFKIDASEYGLQPATSEEMTGGDAQDNAAIAKQVFAGEPGAYRDLVLLNAGIRIWLAERADNIGDGIELARHAIDSGAARAKLDAVRALLTKP
jgi:anthranilate phosphoribosyltransferase